ADAEEHPASRKMVEARDLLRGPDRIALDHETDAGPELDARRRDRRGRERDEGIVAVPVLLRQVTATRPGTLAARGDVRVLGHPERLEPALLQLARELVRPHRVVRREHRHPDVHRSSLPEKLPHDSVAPEPPPLDRSSLDVESLSWRNATASGSSRRRASSAHGANGRRERGGSSSSSCRAATSTTTSAPSAAPRSAARWTT